MRIQVLVEGVRPRVYYEVVDDETAMIFKNCSDGAEVRIVLDGYMAAYVRAAVHRSGALHSPEHSPSITA